MDETTENLDSEMEEMNEEVEETSEDATEETQTDEEKEALKAKVAELESKNKQLFERAKKNPKEPSQDLSSKDILYLAKVDVHEDDMDEVLDWAKFKKIGVKEAYESLKGVLDVKAEQRKTANASQTNAGQRGGNKVTGTQILDGVRAGRFPEDDAGIAALVAAEMAQKQAKD